MCRYILQKIPCKFGITCSFEHEQHPKEPSRDQSKEVEELSSLLEAKTVEVNILLKRLNELERKYRGLNNSQSDSDDSEHEEVDSNDIYQCDQCEFSKSSETGLKIQVTTS